MIADMVTWYADMIIAAIMVLHAVWSGMRV